MNELAGGHCRVMSPSATPVPAADLNDLMRDHRDHLDALVHRLERLGVEQGRISKHVSELVEEYQTEVRRTLDHLVQAARDAGNKAVEQTGQHNEKL
jgi:uncharacterized protein (UPF0335 family)